MRAISSWLRRLLGDPRNEAERIDEEIVEMKRQEEKDLAELSLQLEQQAPSEADNQLEALKQKQNLLARRALHRRTRQTEYQHQQRSNGHGTLGGSKPTNRLQPPSVPAPWRVYLHADSGNYYFFNEVTGLSTWDPPAMPPPPPPPPPPTPPRPASPPPPWQLVLHVQSNQWYYHNLLSGETSWEPPGSAHFAFAK